MSVVVAVLPAPQPAPPHPDGSGCPGAAQPDTGHHPARAPGASRCIPAGKGPGATVTAPTLLGRLSLQALLFCPCAVGSAAEGPNPGEGRRWEVTGEGRGHHFPGAEPWSHPREEGREQICYESGLITTSSFPPGWSKRTRKLY